MFEFDIGVGCNFELRDGQKMLRKTVQRCKSEMFLVSCDSA